MKHSNVYKRAIEKAAQLALDENEQNVERRCRAFTAYLSGLLEDADENLAAELRKVLEASRAQ